MRRFAKGGFYIRSSVEGFIEKFGQFGHVARQIFHQQSYSLIGEVDDITFAVSLFRQLSNGKNRRLGQDFPVVFLIYLLSS